MTESTAPPHKKKLIEVAIPLEAINAASVREKSIRHGHPSTLHLWWARRPLAACRAVLFAQLVDDPSSRPDEFPTDEASEAERKRLFGIIEELVKWENSTNEDVLKPARAEIRKSCGGEMPPVYDPFSGGGSIPLEAQRLGLPAHGSDLNPVAVTIGKAMIEIPPLFRNMEPVHPGVRSANHYRNAEGLAEDIKYYGEWMRERALAKIGPLYPQAALPPEHGGGAATVIAWIWARTVPSPDPAFSDVAVPLVSSFLLSAKKGKEAWLDPDVNREAKTIRWRIRDGGTEEELAKAKLGTTAGKRQAFRCIMSDAPIPYDHIRAAGKSGGMGQTLIAIVAKGKTGRVYLPPTEEQRSAAESPSLAKAASEYRATFLSGEIPVKLTGGTPHKYGLNQWGNLFTDRQLVALTTFGDLIHKARERVERDALAAGRAACVIPLRDGGAGAKAYAEAVSVYLAFVLDKCADYWSAICTWHAPGEKMRNTFGRQAIPMTWDFAEANPFSASSGNFLAMVEWVWKAVAQTVPAAPGCTVQHDAQSVEYPDDAVISTDPPYYDNIAYADLSDFFLCWLKPALRPVWPDLFGFLATPKAAELVASHWRHGSRERAETFFLNGMTEAVANMAKHGSREFPATIYYAFKQSEIAEEGVSSTGWAAFLQAVIGAGYAIVGTWPMRTEMANRMIAKGTNALANSVVLVCRKRPDSAETVTRADFIRALKRDLPPAIASLKAAHIAPADMPQSAIGPGMGLFSRHRAVLEANDEPMTVKTALQLINRELDEYLTGLHGDFDAETRFAVTWFEQHGRGKGEFGEANKIATARSVSVDSAKHAGIVESAAGKVAILPRERLDPDWNPQTAIHPTIWAGCQHMIRALETGGEDAAAMLLKKLGPEAETVRDLAYCLHDICTKRRYAEEAAACNGLIAVWPELTRRAAGIQDVDANRQAELGV